MLQHLCSLEGVPQDEIAEEDGNSYYDHYTDYVDYGTRIIGGSVVRVLDRNSCTLYTSLSILSANPLHHKVSRHYLLNNLIR